jgi:hypothetical protein
MLMAGGILLGCGNDDSGYSTAVDSHNFYATLSLSQHAINLSTVAPYDTMHVQVRALMQDSTPVPGTVILTSSDSNSVSVDSTGLLTAKRKTTKTTIRAKLTYGRYTRTDSATVVVVTTAPSAIPQQLSIVLNPGDSAKTAIASLSGSGSKSFRVVPVSASGDTLPAVTFTAWSSDTLRAKVKTSTGTLIVNGVRPGRVMLYVSTFAYGVARRDSLTYVVGWPLVFYGGVYRRFQTGTLKTILDFNPGTITVGVGANVLWWNTDSLPVDIVFDSPAGATTIPEFALFYSDGEGTGNIPPFSVTDTSGLAKIQPGIAGRHFGQAGQYRYHSTLYGTSGVINVIAEDESTCYSYHADSTGHCTGH